MKKKVFVLFVVIFIFASCMNFFGKTIVDLQRNEVEIPESQDINRIVLISPPLFGTYLCMFGDTDKIVGMHPFCSSMNNKKLISVLAPDIDSINCRFMKGFNVNVESLTNLKPDIVFVYGKQQKEPLENLNIPLIDMLPNSTYDPVETILDWMKVFADVFEADEKYDRYEKAVKNTLAEIESRIANIKPEDKKKAVMIFSNNGKNMQVVGGNFYGSYWMEKCGLINCARNLSGVKEVNIEQIYEWNPDIVYVFRGIKADKYLNNEIMNQDWSVINAFETKDFHTIPEGIFGWEPPNTETTLMLYWTAKKAYPELFEEIDLIEESQRFYEDFFGKNVSVEIIEDVLN